MKDSAEVKLFKAEVELFKKRKKNKKFSTLANIYKTRIGTPIYDVNNPDENLEVLGLENGVQPNKTYTLSTGYVSLNGIMTTYKSQRDKFKIIKGFLEHIYIYYKRNPNIIKENWEWPPYDETTLEKNKPPDLIINNFISKEFFIKKMINLEKFEFLNDRKIIVYLINLEDYYRVTETTDENLIDNEDNTSESSTSILNSKSYEENSLFYENSLFNSPENSVQTPIQNSTETSENSMFIYYNDLSQNIYVNIKNTSDGEKYIFRNINDKNIIYNEYKRYTLGLGTYIFNNVPIQHPMAILNHNIKDSVTYTGDNVLNKTINIDGIDYNYNFYWGNITIHILNSFDVLSIYCYYHGYMGGKNLFTFNPDIKNEYITENLNCSFFPEVKKILCLHNNNESAAIMKEKDGMQDLINSEELNKYEFIFIDSPNLLNNKWWENTQTTNINHAIISIEYLINYINENGPFYGILGHSQGAAMVIVLLSRTNIIFEKVLLFNPYLPTMHQGLMTIINEVQPLLENTLIFLATNDTEYYDLGLNVKDKFQNYIEIISSYSKHELPKNTDETFNDIVEFIKC